MAPAIETQINDLANNVISFKKAQDEILAKFADDGDITKALGAIEALEKRFDDIQSDVQLKLDKIRRTTWDSRGNYRGVFGSEEEARAFGLYCIAKAGEKGWGDEVDAFAKKATDALKRDFPDLHAKAMDSTTDGALVGTEFSTRLIRLVDSFGVFEADAFEMPMTGESLSFLRRTGGMSVFVVGENTAGTQGDPSFGNVTLNARELGTLSFVPRTLDEDSVVAIAELIATEIAQAFAEASDNDGFNGDGSPAYHNYVGVRTRLASINGVDDGGGLVLGSGNAYSELTLGDHDKLMGTLPQYAASGAAWYCSRIYFFTVMVRLMHAVGGVTAGEIEGRRQLLYGGDPVRLCEKLPRTAANSQICALYGNLRLAATVGRRRAVTIESSRDYKFAERQITYLGTRRLAINCHDLGTASAAGPVVGLITAGS